MSRQGASRSAFLLYLAFVVYGSLVPFELRVHNLADALSHFAQIRWLDLGATSRADWIANLLLYMPLAFLGGVAFAAGARSTTGRHVRAVGVLLFCVLVAVAVEFAQVYVMPRTVSLNDLAAEGLGALLGLAVWSFGYRRLLALWTAFRAGGRGAVAAAIVGYGMLYLALALFPFDFVVSGDELAAKLATPSHGWLLAGNAPGLIRTTASLVIEMVAIAPLGMLAGLLVGRISPLRAVLAGMALGLVLELVQLFLVSGVTQGASVLARGLGLAAGAWLGSYLHRHGPLPLAHLVRRLWWPLSPLYGIALLAATGWFTHPVVATAQALRELADTHLMPFYYHYFTTEPLAMASLLANVGMYAPLGLLAWARQLTVPRSRRNGPVAPALWAAALALPLEIGKAWLGDTHPDFTNLLIAAGGAVFSYLLADWLSNAAHHDADTPATPSETTASAAPQPVKVALPGIAPPPPRYAAISLVALAMLGLGLWHYPLAPVLAAVLAIAYGVWLWRAPWVWLGALPAALPVLDLAPYTGRLMLDGYDLLVLATLAVGYWRLTGAPARPWAIPVLGKAYWLLVATTVAALARGLAPVLDGGSISLAASHSAGQALLVGKGLVWALLLIPLLRRVPDSALADGRRLLVAGLAAGLALLTLAVLWERQRFVGLGDFDDVFRVTGNFSNMANGGAYIEAFIAMAFPALAIWTLRQARGAWRLAGLIAAALASYAMLVTFSRGGYAGLVVGLAITAYGLFSTRRKSAPSGRWLPLLMVLGIAAAATPVLLGSFAQSRLGLAAHDLRVRLHHWQGALGLMDPGVVPVLTGMGFGRYPELYLWRADVARPPGTFSVDTAGDGSHFVRLGGGDSYYLDQVVAVMPDHRYTLSARVRFHGDTRSLSIPLCEKALLYSFHCKEVVLRRPAGAAADTWLDLSTSVATAGFGATGRWPAPTVKLSLAAPQLGQRVDVERIGLRDPAGNELLANGTFDHGLNHWLASTDRDLAWHIHETPLEVYFAQGLLGLAAWLLTLAGAARAIAPGLREGDGFAVAIAAGLAGFVTVGLLGSTLDMARLLLLFHLVAFAGLLAPRAAVTRG